MYTFSTGINLVSLRLTNTCYLYLLSNSNNWNKTNQIMYTHIIRMPIFRDDKPITRNRTMNEKQILKGDIKSKRLNLKDEI